MAITYTEANAIEKNSWFKDRVRVATSTYTNYLLNTDAADPEYEAKVSVATRMAQQSNMVVDTLMFTLSGDSEVQANGPCISDTQLQMIVEKTLKKFYPVVPPVAQPAILEQRYRPPQMRQ